MNLLKDITIGQYVPGESTIHRLDPRVKIALSAVLMVLIFVVESYIGFAIIFGFLLLVTLLSGIQFRYVIRGLKPILFLVLITVVFNLFFAKGTLVVPQKIYGISLPITWEGLATAVRMAIRLILLVFSTSLLTLSTSPIQLTDAMENLLAPFKKIGIPAHELAMMMTIALRFIPVLIEETDKIFKAQRSRGARFGRGGIIEKAKSLLPILVPLFVHAFKHAEDLAAAMESRCYRGGEGRTRLRQLKITALDGWAFLFCGIIFSFVAWWNFYGKL
ncbi:MAG: energy-coupling factor transporter transmembrane protein EcfT [Firmicutes bacterium]|nr:energy-coupling factor transporter transmembrane protein EcfT [Bacillota bacterium]